MRDRRPLPHCNPSLLNPAGAITTAAETMSKTPSLEDFRRIVVKVGSSLLSDRADDDRKLCNVFPANRRVAGRPAPVQLLTG